MIAAPLDVGPISWRRETDVVIVGAGAAGLSAALRLIGAGRRVTLLAKTAPGDGSTAWAQGGLAAALDPRDTVAGHVGDTLQAGAGLCDEPAVVALAAAAPDAIRRLVDLGARFDREPGGRLALGLEGGHHARRIVHAGGDATGAEIARVLSAAVRQAAERGQVELLERALAVDALCAANGAVCGLRLIDGAGQVGELLAGAVVLATGGIGRAWPVTTNPATATGDGLALALRAGAVIRDPEFVQFHPTALAPPSTHRGPDARVALISEAVRGEGARLIDTNGTPLMTDVHPLGDLAPRDVVAAAIERRMTSTGSDHVLLDATHFQGAAWREHFPTILALCLERGVDPRREPIPVAPAEHYACGGVWADLDGVTSVPGLYAIGEVASTGVQGANRLASNSLTEALITGERVGELLSRAPTQRQTPLDQPRAPGLPGHLAPQIVAATGNGLGVLRSEAGLETLLTKLSRLAAPATALPRAAAIDDGAVRAGVEATNLHTVSTLIATAARHRTESRGCHRRSDFPDRRPGWHRHQFLQLIDGDLQTVGIESTVAA
jgi:L-aspartate oxidase